MSTKNKQKLSEAQEDALKTALRCGDIGRNNIREATLSVLLDRGLLREDKPHRRWQLTPQGAEVLGADWSRYERYVAALDISRAIAAQEKATDELRGAERVLVNATERLAKCRSALAERAKTVAPEQDVRFLVHELTRWGRQSLIGAGATLEEARSIADAQEPEPALMAIVISNLDGEQVYRREISA